MGDWRDAKDVPQGNVAYAVAKVVDGDTSKPVRWNVASFVHEWTDADGKHPNHGFFMRFTNGRGLIMFESCIGCGAATRRDAAFSGKSCGAATEGIQLTPT